MTTMNVKDASGAIVAIEKPLAPGRAAAADSRPVALSTEDLAALSQLHADLATTLAGYVDGLEALIGTSNTTLSNILTGVATTLTGYVDGLETLITSSNTKLDQVHTDLATTLAAYIDGLETLITASNTKLDSLHTDLGTTLAGFVDGLEGLTGALTETAPASDTASSGLNGRLQRIAQRITSLIALLPAALGAGGGLKVDGSGTALPISAASGGLVDGAIATLGAKADAKSTATDTTSVSAMSVLKQISASVQASAAAVSVASATLSSVNSLATTQQLLASNASRQGVAIVNTDANDLYVKYGTTATTAGGGYTVLIPSGSYWEMPRPIYTGRIDGIWAADGAGLAEITEL